MNMHEGASIERLHILRTQAYTQIFNPLVLLKKPILLEKARESLQEFNANNKLNKSYALSPSDMFPATFIPGIPGVIWDEYPFGQQATIAMARLAIEDLKGGKDPNAKDLISALQKIIAHLESAIN